MDLSLLFTPRGRHYNPNLSQLRNRDTSSGGEIPLPVLSPNSDDMTMIASPETLSFTFRSGAVGMGTTSRSPSTTHIPVTTPAAAHALNAQSVSASPALILNQTLTQSAEFYKRQGGTPSPQKSRATTSVSLRATSTIPHHVPPHHVHVVPDGVGEFVGRTGMWTRLRQSVHPTKDRPPKRILPNVKVPPVKTAEQPVAHPMHHHSRTDVAERRKRQQHTERERIMERRKAERATYRHSDFIKWKHDITRGKIIARHAILASSSKQEAEDEADVFPFSEEEYLNILRVFEQVDTDCDGQLSYQDLCTAGTILKGRTIDVVHFRRMDKDRSGLVDFLEVLRMFYPATPVGVLQRAARRWGVPENRGLAAVLEGTKTWRDRLPEEEVTEITNMFMRMSGDSPTLTLTKMHKHMSHRLTLDVLDIAENAFRAADSDHDEKLSLEEFGAMMEMAFKRA